MDVEASHDTVSDYLLAHSSPQDDVLARLAEETRTSFGGVSEMQITADEGALLTLLTRLVGAAYTIEVGTFTGYSSICIARGLAPGGRLLACDVSGEWTDLARRYWDEAGVTDRIELRLAPAAETLAALPPDPIVDLAFVDADKESYPTYYEELVPRLRSGGLVVLDNVLLGGRVFDEANQSERVTTMRAVNDRVAADDRVDAVMLPVRDGVTIARRR
ncbi:MAG TPA: SAM-dependent methyltransferase [Nocardioides bacterium]|nr:SAM-dependent methyltransferase [Nocardioides sp.]